MILIALLIGVIVIVAAIRNSQGALVSALGQDVPGFVIWAAALFAVGAVGYVPGLKPVSRGLLALIILVLILRNYQAVISGFQAAWTSPPAAGSSPNVPGSLSAPSTSSGSGPSSDELEQATEVAGVFA
jgi:hypothetical protein